MRTACRPRTGPLVGVHSDSAKTNPFEPKRKPCKQQRSLQRSTCWWWAEASTARASRATSPAAALSVLLCEQDDLAQHTSSSSTKLIHGGLRYLEHYEFSLVRKALAEREVLLKSAPHIMWPLRFVMPHDPAMRPVWMIRAGLFLYDHLARREWLPPSRVGRRCASTRPARR